MTSWTVVQVADWLKGNGFEKYIEIFIDQDIDGVALMGLQDDEIFKLLSLSNEDGTKRNPSMRIQRKFRAILEEYQTAVKQERKKRRRNSSSVTSSRNATDTNNEIEPYSKTHTIEPTNVSMKFFTNESICSILTKYFLKNYNVKCHIPTSNPNDPQAALHMKFSGVKDNVKHVQKDLQLFFQTIETKIFNNENIDKRVIKWSKHIYSDSALTILQKIFSDKNKFTVWEKTHMLSGYYVVYYLRGQHQFSVSEDFLTHTLNHEISYVKDIVIPDVQNMPKKFRKELDQLINNKKQQQREHQTMAIIYCQYPDQTEMKISFFGLKTQVNIAKNQMKMLINKHRIQTIRLGLHSKQREHLLNNYLCELKKIELDHIDDNVKIEISADSIHTPQYLIRKIKQLIQSMIFQETTLILQYIPNAFRLTEQDSLQLQRLAQNFNAEIDRIDTITRKELISLPKGKNITTSKYTIKQSNQFYSSLSIPRILSIADNTIEIHKSYDLTIDMTIISTEIDAYKKGIDPKYGNSYFESDDEKNILFLHWLLPRLEETHHQLKQSIRTFISALFKQLDTLCTDGEKSIVLSTTDWEKYQSRKQLVEGILYELKQQLGLKQFSNRRWKLLFVFDDEQIDFFNEFSQVILALQTNKDDYEQFFYSVSTTSIIIKTSDHGHISKCENALHHYIKNHLVITSELIDPFDPHLWNQSMINTYYKYCLEKFVLPKVYPQRLELIGPPVAVNEAKQKYELMSKIERQRPFESDYYNITLSCCSDDKILARQLTHRLIDEGYVVSTDYSDHSSSNIMSQMDRTDLTIICFSFHYSDNYRCMTTMKSITGSGKKFLPILFTKTLMDQENGWLQRTTAEELFYEAFQQEIRFKLKEDLDLDYDHLMIELLQHTKSGTADEGHSMPSTLPDEEEKLDQQDRLSQFTPEQIQEKQRIYEQRIQEIREKNQIPEDELKDLIESLTGILQAQEDTDAQENEEDDVQMTSDSESEHDEKERTNVSDYLNDFLSSIQRWLEKAANGLVIKGNLPPFTLTRDYNDAVFPIPTTDKVPWWTATATLDDFDHSSLNLHWQDPRLIVGSWCNYDECHHYYQKLIDRESRFREDKQEERSKEVEKDTTTRYPHFKTTIKKGTIVWPEIKEKLGSGQKTKEEIRKREQLDDPNNNTWRSKRLFPWRQRFIQMKIKNILQWKEFCATQSD